MLDARFADIPIGITSLSHEGGQDWAESSPARGDQHVLQPRGQRLRKTSCELAFVGADFEEHLAKFDEAASLDEPALFVHPLRGSYLAICRDWVYAINETGNIATGTCVFVEYSPPRAVTPISAGVVSIAGPAAMRVAVERSTAAASAASLPTPSSLAAALAAVEDWSANDSDLREVQTRLSATVDRINEDLAKLHPSTWEAWALYRSLLRARSQLVQSGQAVVADTDNLLEVVTERSEPLISFARRIYGGAQARERADELKRLNGIKTPGMVPSGTRLRVAPP